MIMGKAGMSSVWKFVKEALNAPDLIIQSRSQTENEVDYRSEILNFEFRLREPARFPAQQGL